MHYAVYNARKEEKIYWILFERGKKPSQTINSVIKHAYGQNSSNNCTNRRGYNERNRCKREKNSNIHIIFTFHIVQFSFNWMQLKCLVANSEHWAFYDQGHVWDA